MTIIRDEPPPRPSPAPRERELSEPGPSPVKRGREGPDAKRREGGGSGPHHYDYLRDPDAIYHASFAAIEREVDLSGVAPELHPLALRLVHAAGDASVVAGLAASPGGVARGRAALVAGAPILVDAAMVAAGITRRHLPAGNRVIATIGDARVPELSARLGTTRSAAAVELWRDDLPGALVAIGNAPTALFHLLEMIGAGTPPPALVLGFPVGFVGAAEAKAALVANPFGLPFIALPGRRGGSALAAAAVNALAR
jgi:precorrin-8X/cobalt-precorrin-8 methylmutase